MKKRIISTIIFACLYIGDTLHAQTWESIAISDLKKGNFSKVENKLATLNEVEKKEMHG